jgi:hypothetical protein
LVVAVIDDLTYFYDEQSHLVCRPFSLSNLHAMAADLGIKRCWFHNGGGGRFPHYDVPNKLQAHVAANAVLISPRETLDIIKGG